MKGIDLIKRMPLDLQKEFAREFVKQKSKKRLIEYLEMDFGQVSILNFYFFMTDAFIWHETKKGFNYWSRVQGMY